MPFATRKTTKGCVQVYNRKTRKVYAKCTTQKKADKQLRLLRAIEYNPDFTPIASSSSSSRNRKNTHKNQKRKNNLR